MSEPVDLASLRREGFRPLGAILRDDVGLRPARSIDATRRRRRPLAGPTLAGLAPIVFRACAEGPAEALVGRRATAIDMALMLDEVADLKDPRFGRLARLARHGAARIRRFLGHELSKEVDA